IALAGTGVFGGHLGWQLARLDTTDTTLCLRLFRSNRDAGLLLGLFLAGAALV
ncbi:MAG: 4-hydroxybenzoate octaprenyltransferase, partial [Gemmobacter sp.]|nr:4-hydroxybenzoate octaprenyltransferase [Gemmobacter sp.]